MTTKRLGIFTIFSACEPATKTYTRSLCTITKMTDKGKIRELNQRIDEILFYEWDPIGISDEPCARAEYSSYTMTILKYVLKEDLNQIVNQLNKIVVDSMGLISNNEHNLKIAQKLLDYKYAIEQGLK